MKNKCFPFLRYLIGILFLLLPISGVRGQEITAHAAVSRDLTYKTVDGHALKLDFYRADTTANRPKPLLVFIHGGSWMHGDKSELNGGFQHQILEALLRAGVNVAAINYRLVSDKSEIFYPEPLSDCKDAVRWLKSRAKELAVDTSNVNIAGTSAGAHLSLLLAYSPDTLGRGDKALSPYSARVKRCVDIYGPTNLCKMLRPTFNPLILPLAKLFVPKSLMHTRQTLLYAFSGTTGRHPHLQRKACKIFSPVVYVDHAVPTLIFHGNKDGLVPFKQSVRLQSLLKHQGKLSELHTIEGQDHGFPTLSEEKGAEIARQIVSFLSH